MRPPQPSAPSGGTRVTAPATTGPASQSAAPSPAASAMRPAPPLPGAAAPAHAVETARSRLAEQPRVKIDTPRLHGSIDAAGGAHRRSDARHLSRDRRPEEPRGRAAVADRDRRTPISPNSAGLPARPDVKVPGPQTRVDRLGRAADPDRPRHLDLGQRAGLVFTRTICGRSELHVHGARCGAQYRPAPRSSCCPTG